MTSHSNSKKQSDWLIFLILLVVTLLIYVPGMNRLGYYRDDWNNLFNAYTQGSEMLISHYASDRPLDGYLLRYAFDLFGYSPLPYLVLNLVCRFLCALCFYCSILAVWKRLKFQAFVAAVLFLVFPGFLRQVDGIAYLPHQIAMLSIAASIWLSLLALQSKKLIWKVLLTLISIGLAILEMFLMEYYLALEVLRFGFFYCFYYNRKDAGQLTIFRSVLRAYIPCLLGVFFFFFWRGFVFEASRAGADLKPIFQEFLLHPKFVGAEWLKKLLLNWFKTVFGSWVIPVYNELNPLTAKLFWSAAARALIPTLIFIFGFITLMPERKNAKPSSLESHTAPRKANWRVQWIVLGAIGTFLTLIPIIMAGREITFSSSLDRFGYPTSFQVILFFVGMSASLEGKWLKAALFSGLVWASILVQIVNKDHYIAQTETVNDFWWQLSWRAPEIEPESLVLPFIYGFSAEEDYEVFVPIHLIYHPDEDHVVIGSDLLNQQTVRNVNMKEVIGRKVREIFLWKNYGKILAVSKPAAKSCLQVIDGRSPVYSPMEWSKIQEIGTASQLNFIHVNAGGKIPPAELFGPEPEHGWCYYYQKMSVAQQKEDWAEAAEIADAALAAGAHAEDAAEWLPLVQAYAYTGRFKEAKPYGEILKTDPYLKFQTCEYFRKAPDFLSLPITDKEAQMFLEMEFCD